MKRYTVVLDNLNVVNIFHRVSIPRGRVLAYSISSKLVHGATIAYCYMNFGEAVVDNAEYFWCSLYARDSVVRHIDEVSNGVLHFRIVTDVGLTPVITLWYADETTEFQVDV